MSFLSIRVLALALFWAVTCISEGAEGRLLLEPAVQLEYPNKHFSQTADTIRKINSRDIAIELFGKPTGSGKIYFRRVVTPGFMKFETSLEKTIYFRPGNDQEERALLIFNLFWAAGSSSERGDLLLFVLHDSHPVLIQEFSYDRQAEGTGETFNLKDLSLTIRARANDDSPHCCPRHLDIERFQWNGWRFRLAGRKVIALPKH
jgi:hypothetical protein